MSSERQSIWRQELCNENLLSDGETPFSIQIGILMKCLKGMERNHEPGIIYARVSAPGIMNLDHALFTVAQDYPAFLHTYIRIQSRGCAWEVLLELWTCSAWREERGYDFENWTHCRRAWPLFILAEDLRTKKGKLWDREEPTLVGFNNWPYRMLDGTHHERKSNADDIHLNSLRKKASPEWAKHI